MTEVYKAISMVAAELANEGIAKSRTNTQGASYKFRGIDDVLNTIATLLPKHGLVIVPRVLERDCVERISKNGGALFYTTVKVEFDLIAVLDGSKHTASFYGEAMDSSDKSTNKAMSAAYKYMAIQTFCIPTEGDNDTENYTHEVEPRKQEPAKKQEPKHPSYAEMKRQLIALENELLDVRSKVTLEQSWGIWRETIVDWTDDYKKAAREKFAVKGKALSTPEQDIQDAFPGSTVTNERIMHPLMAGE